MKKLLLIFFAFLCTTMASAAIDERKIDIYFANGIMTEEDDAEYNALEILKPAVIDLLGLQVYNNHIGEVGYVYNQTANISPSHVLFGNAYQICEVTQ